MPLFDGGDFDAGYNYKYKPVEFVTPAGLQKAVLEAVITGISFGTRLNALSVDRCYLLDRQCGTHVVRMWCACDMHVVRMWYACGTHVSMSQTCSCMRETLHSDDDCWNIQPEAAFGGVTMQ